MSYGRLTGEEARLGEEISELLARAGKVGADEDAELGEAVRGDGLPDALKRREARLAAIQAAKARLEAEQRVRDRERSCPPDQDRNPKGARPYKHRFGEPEAKARSNFTDPESAIMKTSSEGFQQCCNAQLVVGKNQVIVATAVDRGATDQGQLLPMLEAAAATAGRMPEEVLADAGYCNEADLAELEARNIRGHVALGREGREHATVDRHRRPATHRMGEHLATEQGRAEYAERMDAEVPNGWIKEVPGFRRFSLRGLEKVQGEWSLVCLAVNLRRMANLMAA